ncbi:MAG TPA: adenylate/guanylate cyclase domain-containing protein [Verrucomicrobiae bacterium]|nr:adenylate/guanylate cyclase domain-containing protein [Verrucomicrobiae bacterium]
MTTALGLALHLFPTAWEGVPLGEGLVYKSYNLPFAPRPTIDVSHDRAILIFMDEDSHDTLHQPKNAAWDRGLHADLLDRLRTDGAAGAVFDIVFSDPGPDPAKDDRFAAAIKAFGKVILAVDRETTTQAGISSLIVVPPIEKFSDVAADVGFTELRPNNDLIVRRHFHGGKDDVVTSMSWAAAKMVGAAVTTNEANRLSDYWVNYYGPAGSLPSISYYRALSPDLPRGFFSNKVAFIGSKLLTRFAGDRKDEYPTPYPKTVEYKNPFTPGAEIQATLFLNLVRGDWMVRLEKGFETLIVVLFGIGFGGGLIQIKRPIYTFAVTLVVTLGVLLLIYYLFARHRLWCDWVIPVGVQIPFALTWSIAWNSISLYVQKRLMEQSIAMYVSPKRVKQIVNNPEILKPGAEKQELSIMFSDIANFTSMTEGMDSDELAHLMNSYFEKAVGGCIHPTDGTVVKFIGDAIFAIWNAPERQANHQELACRGVLLLRDEVSAFFSSKGGTNVCTRIGLHCGVANVGNFGSSSRVDYTALGENINLASRMEGLNKYTGTDILVTGDVHKHVSEKFVFRHAGRFKLKGFEKAVEVHELLATVDKAEESRAWREAFAGALDLYLKRNFPAAEAAFQQVIEMRGGKDGPSALYLKHLKELREHPLPDDWQGEIELKDK